MIKFRGFIAIDIKAYPKLIQFINEIKTTGAYVKLIELEYIHITLKFLGDTNEDYLNKIEEIMKNSVNDFDPFEIKLKGAGVFPNKNYIKVLWIGIENSDSIGEIANKIDEKLYSLGFEREKRKFAAHLTVARVKSAKNKEELIKLVNKYEDIEFGTLKIDSIKLKKSELTPKGPIYTTLKDVRL